MKKIAVVLSGCGVFDGSEIHESVLLLLNLKRAGFAVEFLAPDIEQAHVVDHLAGEPAEGQKRRVLVEAARIARGKVRDLATARAIEFDGIAFPGGFGAAKNLCTFAVDGARMTVNSEVERFVREGVESRKPMLFLCISPVIAAKVIGDGVAVTLGADSPLVGAVASWGARHVATPVRECLVDQAHRLVTVPAYMYDAEITDVAAGIAQGVAAFQTLIG
ncbi:isoprenoid biosynthesis glyoxalase ElbB [bacterium]|nr:isoprenoid biosynthesis glyoxalase ElbB [bacterium]